MKHTLLGMSFLGMLALASCGNGTASNGTAPKIDSTASKTESATERNKKVVMVSEGALNMHDVNGVFKDVAPGFMEYGDGSMPPVNTDSAKQMIGMFLASFPDMKGENQTYVAEGNQVLVMSDYTLTFKNDLKEMNIKATGKTIKFRDVDIFTLDDNGKITSHRNIYPNMAIFAQLGVDMAKMQAMMEKDMKKSK